MNNNYSKLSEEVTRILANEYSKENLPENLYSYFEEKYLSYVEDEEQYDVPIDTVGLELSIQYIKSVTEQLALGHSFDWATLFAYYCPDYNNVVDWVFHDLKERDKNLALTEVRIHAKSFGKDKYFEKFYVELVTMYDTGYSDAELEYHSSQ